MSNFLCERLLSCHVIHPYRLTDLRLIVYMNESFLAYISLSSAPLKDHVSFSNSSPLTTVTTTERIKQRQMQRQNRDFGLLSSTQTSHFKWPLVCTTLTPLSCSRFCTPFVFSTPSQLPQVQTFVTFTAPQLAIVVYQNVYNGFDFLDLLSLRSIGAVFCLLVKTWRSPCLIGRARNYLSSPSPIHNSLLWFVEMYKTGIFFTLCS